MPQVTFENGQQSEITPITVEPGTQRWKTWPDGTQDQVVPVAIVSQTGSSGNGGDPADYTLKDWNGDLISAASTVAMASGVRYRIRLKLRKQETITGIALVVSGAGATLTAGQNKAVLYRADGSKVAEVDCETIWNTTGNKRIAFAAPVVCPADDYYVVLLSVGTTPPTLRRFQSNDINFDLATADLRFASSAAGQTTVEATLNRGSGYFGTTFSFWVGLY